MECQLQNSYQLNWICKTNNAVPHASRGKYFVDNHGMPLRVNWPSFCILSKLHLSLQQAGIDRVVQLRFRTFSHGNNRWFIFNKSLVTLWNFGVHFVLGMTLVGYYLVLDDFKVWAPTKVESCQNSPSVCDLSPLVGFAVLYLRQI